MDDTNAPVISPDVGPGTASEAMPATPDSPSITPETPSPESVAAETSLGGTTSSAGQVISPTDSNTTSRPSSPTGSVPAATNPPVVGKGSMFAGRRKLVALIAIVVIILLAAGYAFAFYLPNTPSHVYSSGLTNTGQALDKLITYTQTQDKASYKSAALNSTLKYKSASGSFDATLSGAFDKNSNGNLQFKADVEGENITANLRSVKAAGNTSPDIYLQVTGIKNYLDSAGLNDFDSLDGQWISIDHTLLDTYSASLKQELNSTSDSSVADASGVPTADQLNDALNKVQTVNKQYIFTTDKSKAVLTNQKFIAKETENGRAQNHYKVGYDKSHLQAYVSALGSALDSSKLNDWSKKANDGKSLSVSMNLKDLENTIKNGKGDYTFDLWVDAKTKLVSSLRFTDPADKSSVFVIGQNYTGGTQYPFSFTFSDKATDGTPEKGALNLTVDSKTNKYTGSFTLDTHDTSGSISVEANFTVTPSNDAVKVTAPSGTESITDLLNQLGLGGLLDSGATTDQPGGSLDGSGLFTLTQ
jgi:hypothetical protein